MFVTYLNSLQLSLHIYFIVFTKIFIKFNDSDRLLSFGYLSIILTRPKTNFKQNGSFSHSKGFCNVNKLPSFHELLNNFTFLICYPYDILFLGSNNVFKFLNQSRQFWSAFWSMSLLSLSLLSFLIKFWKANHKSK